MEKYSFEKAQEEVLKMRGKVESDETRTYDEAEKIVEKKKFGDFLSQQISLPREQWSVEFKEYIKGKYCERYQKEREETRKHSTEEVLERCELYLEELNLNEEDFRDKRILDLGSGAGEFVKICIDKELSEEVYGVDIEPESFSLEERYKEHFFKGSFSDELPVRDLDYVIAVGSVFAFAGDEEGGTKKILKRAIDVIKSDGEIRIAGIRKASPGSALKGVHVSYKKWTEILGELVSEEDIEYELHPIDIWVDVWGEYEHGETEVALSHALVIRKKVSSVQ